LFSLTLVLLQSVLTLGPATTSFPAPYPFSLVFQVSDRPFMFQVRFFFSFPPYAALPHYELARPSPHFDFIWERVCSEQLRSFFPIPVQLQPLGFRRASFGYETGNPSSSLAQGASSACILTSVLLFRRRSPLSSMQYRAIFSSVTVPISASFHKSILNFFP